MERYEHKKVEEKWREKWAQANVYMTTEDIDKEKFYILDMFPYPSGEGLHVGHPKGYIATDIISRYKKMQNFNVLHPMGWDAFGLPAEQYALKNKVHPRIGTDKNIATFKKQLEKISLNYDWEREISTTDPEFYKWTQWTFIQMYKKGLVFQSNEPINWCPSCKTGLANEDLENGCCERCDTPIEKKKIPQWVIKITEYADRLLEDLDKLDWQEHIKELQRNWIGRSEGAEIEFKVKSEKLESEEKKTALILHGTGGTNEKNWYPWIQEQLENQGYKVFVPNMPNSDMPISKDWLAELEKLKDVIDENTIIIGHSLGCPVAWQFIEKINKKIAKLYLIAPTHPSMDWKLIKNTHDTEVANKIKIFTQEDVNWSNIEKLTDQIVIYLSEDDPYIPFVIQELFKKDINAKYRLYKDKGHFNVSTTKMTEFPELLDEILDFNLHGDNNNDIDKIKVFTTRPDTLFGATYMVLAPEHELVEKLKVKSIKNIDEVEKYQKEASKKTDIERTAEGREKTGVRLEGIMAVNPVNNEEIPIFIADYVLADYGTGAIMAVPAHDERDFEFAQKYNIDIKQVIEPLFIDKTKSSSPRKNLEFVDRDVITAIVKHWEEDKYLTLKWKKVDWTTFVTSGIEDGQTPEQAARAEVLEETGYKNLKLIKNLGKSHSKFFHNPKNVNRFAHFESFYFELENDEQNIVDKEEKAIHDIVWMSKKEIEENIVAGGQRWAWDKIQKGEVYTGSGIMINSGEFDGLNSEEVKEKITEFAGGEMTTSYKLRDWVFSRQRYWGEPIPLIHCEKCGVVTVPEDELPLELPEVESYEPTGTGESPLAAIDSWVNTTCSECGGEARRETNTMPQWAGSSWYYLRYIDPHNTEALVYKEKDKYWSPVDFYVGGAEHATRHLIYARFWHKFLYDIGVVNYDEPFSKLQTVGLIMAEDGRKMSKRWGNVINPDDVIERFGADSFRVYEMFMGPFDASVAWSTESLVGSRKFLEKVWKVYQNGFTDGETSESLQKTLHKTIKKVGEDIGTMKYNTAISAMMILVNQLEKEKSIANDDFAKFLKILSPFAPHITQELWSQMGNKTFLIEEDWPQYDEKYLVDDEIELVVQVNGKVRDKIMVNADIDEEQAKQKALGSEKVRKYIKYKEIKKVIFVQGKLISIVV